MAALGRRGILRLATLFPPIAYLAGAASRHAPSVLVACLLAHLLAICQGVLFGALSLQAAGARSVASCVTTWRNAYAGDESLLFLPSWPD